MPKQKRKKRDDPKFLKNSRSPLGKDWNSLVRTLQSLAQDKGGPSTERKSETRVTHLERGGGGVLERCRPEVNDLKGGQP